MAPKLPIKARKFLEATRYAGASLVAITTGVTEVDITIPTAWTSIEVDIVPQVILNFLTSYGVEPLPGKTNFRTGFRLILGSPAPAGAKMSYSMWVTP